MRNIDYRLAQFFEPAVPQIKYGDRQQYRREKGKQ